MSENPQLRIFRILQDKEKKEYISILQNCLEQLRPTRNLVGPNGSYNSDHLFVNIDKIPEIENYFLNVIKSYERFNSDHNIRVLISNIQQIILAYYSLMNKDARELNIQIFAMPWDKIISGEIDLLNPEIDSSTPQIYSSNPFTVNSITRRSGGRTKKRRNKKRRTLRRKPIPTQKK